MFRRVYLGIQLGILLFCTITSGAYATVNLKDYGGLPNMSMVTISPNGQLLAYRNTTEKLDALVVLSLSDKKVLSTIDLSNIEPDGIFFINDDQIIFRASEYTRVAGFRGKFDLSTAFVHSIKDKKTRQLLIPGEKILAGQTGLGGIVGITPDGNYALMPAFTQVDNHFPTPKYALYKVNLKKKNLRVVHAGDYQAVDFFVNAEGDAIAQEEFDERNSEHRILSLQNNKWVKIFSEETKIRNRAFVGLTPDYKSLVMLLTDESNRKSYYTMSLADGSIKGPLLSRDNADIEGVITNVNRVVFGVRYSGFTPSYQFFDEKLNQRMKDVVAQFPEQSVWLIHWSPDWKHWVVNVEGSDYPDDFFLFSDNAEPKFLASGRPNILPEQLHPIGKATYVARDGMKIPSLLTIPRDKVSAIKNLPTIIYPHGGPASYDRIGFNPFAQALAAQGYLVMQPQFRGSTGFGYNHYQSGLGEWGKKMQDDITDAVKFLTSKGYADPKRICIMGASYGGYAALAGGAFTPELYKCVVSINGLGDLNDMYSWDKSQDGAKSESAAYWALQYGKGDIDKNKLAQVSPLNSADKFGAPALLIHSENDKIVPIRQSQDMAKALKKNNKSVELIELEGDNHHLTEGPTRQQALEASIKFINAHLQ